MLKKTIGYCILALHVLLVFVLLFENSIELPLWLQAAGRTHPLILHLPIGLVLVTALLIFGKKLLGGDSLGDVISFLLYLTAIAASLAALMGVFLSREGGYAEDDLLFHKWLGVGFSFLCWALPGLRADSALQKVLVTLAVLAMLFVGHFGANLTHGENFVLGPLQEEDEIKLRVVTDSSTLFTAALEPILENKCYGCHNEQKAKGRLVMTSFDKLIAGGKNGSLWVPGDPANSLLVERLTLPLDEKKHMPPRDKAQLTPEEIQFITGWIRHGADAEVQIRELERSDTLSLLASSIISRYSQPVVQSRYRFASASPDVIRQLNTPYRNVFPIALNEPALQADFFLSGSFQKQFLEELLTVREQVVSINLTRMPVVDSDLAILSQFPNLEKVVLNNTNVQGDGLSQLAALPNLQMVSLAGTAVELESLRSLAANESLRDVFVWNTAVTAEEIVSLRNDAAHINWDLGYQQDESEMLRLSPPFVRNDDQVVDPNEPIELKHKLPGTVIRYTLDGQRPDSVSSPLYENAVSLKGYTLLTTQAFKEGWLSSEAKEYIFFTKGYKPVRAELKTSPDPQYPGDGALTLIDDKKGMPDFYRDPVWMAFRNGPLEAWFFFSGVEPPTVSSITLSYARNIGAMCMPPASLEVWGGRSPQQLALLGKIVPLQPTDYVSTRIEGATVGIKPSSFACYKIVARPLEKLPAFREAPKDKGWLMVDEIFFN